MDACNQASGSTTTQNVEARSLEGLFAKRLSEVNRDKLFIFPSKISPRSFEASKRLGRTGAIDRSRHASIFDEYRSIVSKLIKHSHSILI